VGLPLDARGFLRVRPTLQLASSSPEGGGALDDVFAAGDAAAIEGYPRPKAGVYAVRAGPFLAENLRRRARWLAEEASSSSSPPPPPPPALLEFRPQKHALALISAGTKWAMVVRPPFPLCPSGEWAWRWKDRIDRAFVRRYDPLSAARAGEGGGDDGDGGGLSG
jgi:selenide,water dikinase